MTTAVIVHRLHLQSDNYRSSKLVSTQRLIENHSSYLTFSIGSGIILIIICYDGVTTCLGFWVLMLPSLILLWDWLSTSAWLLLHIWSVSCNILYTLKLQVYNKSKTVILNSSKYMFASLICFSFDRQKEVAWAHINKYKERNLIDQTSQNLVYLVLDLLSILLSATADVPIIYQVISCIWH